MLILATAALFHVLAIHGMLWDGVLGAYMIALFLDAAILAFIAYCIWQ
ncbi:MAG: hypothetical protein SVO01_07915 [Thermotogota bacterium]|nr:hypothetical protein [Thermotogota bacterium]